MRTPRTPRDQLKEFATPQSTYSTSCIMDCPDTCALEVTIRDGRIARITGTNSHPNTAGVICTKISRYAERVYYPGRLLYPMRRTGAKGSGAFTPISWGEAIAIIVDKFKAIVDEWGGEAILPYHYGGSNGLLGDEFIDDYFFARLGASRLEKTICAAPSTAVATEMYGKMPGVAFDDYVYARCIIIWGANPKASNIHLVPYLREARRRGAFLAVVDPTKTFSRREADLHLPVYPGTDLPVALAMIRYWHENGRLDQDFLQKHTVGLTPLLKAAAEWPIDRAAVEARVPADELRLLAEKYAETRPAVIRAGWGTERNRNGGQALAAIFTMPALLGKFGERGGGYTMSNGGAVRVNTAKIFGNYAWNTRKINMTRLGEALTEELNPPVKALFVYNCNPAVTVPNQNRVLQGLAREDLFTIVFDQVFTDTARYADILLPATTFLEQHEIRKAYGSYVIGGIRPVIDQCGKARPNEEVFAALGRGMGWQDEVFGWDSKTYLRKVIEALDLRDGPALPELLESGGCQRVVFNGDNPVQFVTIFPQTADKKIHLTPPCLGANPYVYVPLHEPEYPLALISPASSRMISSTLAECNYPELEVLVHPVDAAARGIESRDLIRVFNSLGEVICKARVSEKVREGVVSMPKGAWMKSSQNQRVSTALCPDTVNQVAGGACFNDARVEIERFRL